MPETGAPGAALLGLLGLLVGSFLNVVIHRLPRMMELRWAAECANLHPTDESQAAVPAGTPPDTFNLMVPSSRCPHCGHQIRWFENIPVVSYLALGGRCSDCRLDGGSGAVCHRTIQGQPPVYRL